MSPQDYLMTAVLTLGSIIVVVCIAIMLITIITCPVPSCTNPKQGRRANRDKPLTGAMRLTYKDYQALTDLRNVKEETSFGLEPGDLRFDGKGTLIDENY
jgi:hypothetical protein